MQKHNYFKNITKLVTRRYITVITLTASGIFPSKGIRLVAMSRPNVYYYAAKKYISKPQNKWKHWHYTNPWDSRRPDNQKNFMTQILKKDYEIY